MKQKVPLDSYLCFKKLGLSWFLLYFRLFNIVDCIANDCIPSAHLWCQKNGKVFDRKPIHYHSTSCVTTTAQKDSNFKVAQNSLVQFIT